MDNIFPNGMVGLDGKIYISFNNILEIIDESDAYFLINPD
jgi:hypothetical protein